MKRLFLLAFFLWTALAQAGAPTNVGYWAAANCASLSPVDNQTVCLQHNTAGGRTAGHVYVYRGSVWVDISVDVGGGGTGDALTTNPLSQFAATTSAQLAGVMTNETGSGLLVFGTSPTLTTPNLGTPSALTLTNATGLPLTTGVTGNLPVARLNSGSAASSSTFWRGDGTWATPATAGTVGTSILKGSGTGGFANAVSGTDYAPATSGTAILKGSGAGAFSNAVAGTDYQAPISGTAPIVVASNVVSCPTCSTGGNVSTSGSPVANQVAYFTSGTAITGDSLFIFDPVLKTLSVGSSGGFAITYGHDTLTANRTVTSPDSNSITVSTTGLAAVANQFVTGIDSTTKAITRSAVDAAAIASGTIAPARLGSGSGGATKFLREDSTWQTLAGGGDALVASPLSQFASTTSAQFAGVISNETGTGLVVLNTTPTLVTPVLGAATGTSLNLSGLTASRCVETDGSKNLVSAGAACGSGGGLASTDIDTSAEIAAIVTNETGSGALVFATSPTLVTPALGTPASGVLTNATGLPISTGVSGLGTGVATFLATPSSANLATALTGETGTGAVVFGTAPTIDAPIVTSYIRIPRVTAFPGSPAAGDTVIVTDDSVAGACDSAAGSITTLCQYSGSAWVKLGDGTGAGGSLTSADIDTSAELAGIVGNETGTGALVFATSPTLVTPVLGTPASGVATNLTGLPLTTGVTGILPRANGGECTAYVAPGSNVLQAAIDALPDAGGILCLGAGTYTQTTAITLGNGSTSAISTKNGMVIRGVAAPTSNGYQTFAAAAATTINCTGTSDGNCVNVAGPVEGWGLDNLRLTGVNSGTTSYGLYVRGGRFGWARNLDIVDFKKGVFLSTWSSWTGPGTMRDTLHNELDNINITLTSGATHGLHLDGQHVQANADFNHLRRIHVHMIGINATCMELGWSDNNHIEDVSCGGGGASAKGLVFNYSTLSFGPINNHITGFDAALDSITNVGTPSGPYNNYLVLSEANGATCPGLANLIVYGCSTAFFNNLSVRGTVAQTGSTSGTVTQQVQAAAGTYNWNWPTSAGTAGQVLTSQAGGATAMTWTTPSGGGGTLNGARAYNNANFSAANGAVTAITLNSERFDNGGLHDTSSNTSRITFPSACVAVVTANIQWAANDQGSARSLLIRLNGTTVIGATAFANDAGVFAAAAFQQSVSTIYSFASSDYIEMAVYQDSGGALNILNSGNESPEFSAQCITS